MLASTFDPRAYGAAVAEILALDGSGARLMPLAHGVCSSAQARTLLSTHTPRGLFPSSRAPEAALAGLWLYFSCLDESHTLSQDVKSTDGSFWHGIMHRQEPDAGNAGYWFRRVGQHPVFPALRDEAQRIAAAGAFAVGAAWDPFYMIEACEKARREPGSEFERTMLEIQRAEWQLLFDYCARPSQ